MKIIFRENRSAISKEEAKNLPLYVWSSMYEDYISWKSVSYFERRGQPTHGLYGNVGSLTVDLLEKKI